MASGRANALSTMVGMMMGTVTIASLLAAAVQDVVECEVEVIDIPELGVRVLIISPAPQKAE